MKTPVRVCDEFDILDSNNRCIAECGSAEAAVKIEKALNCHEDLVRALKELLASIEPIGDKWATVYKAKEVLAKVEKSPEDDIEQARRLVR